MRLLHTVVILTNGVAPTAAAVASRGNGIPQQLAASDRRSRSRAHHGGTGAARYTRTPPVWVRTRVVVADKAMRETYVFPTARPAPRR